MKSKVTNLTRIFFFLFFVSIALAIINYFITGGDKYTLTTLMAVSLVLMPLSFAFFGADLMLHSYKPFTNGAFLNGVVIFLAGVSWLIIFIRGPLLKYSLNEPVNLTCGIIFMLAVIVGFINNIRK